MGTSTTATAMLAVVFQLQKCNGFSKSEGTMIKELQTFNSYPREESQTLAAIPLFEHNKNTTHPGRYGYNAALAAAVTLSR